MNEKTRKEKNVKKVNKWKWAFLLLLFIILLGFFAFLKLLEPRSIEKNKDTVYSTADEIEITSSLNKKDAEFVMNSYLDTQTEDENISYQIEIDEVIDLTSTIKIQSLELPIEMTFEPFATDKGNLQLRAQSMEVASLSLPLGLVLKLLTNQIDLPEYVQVDSKEKIIQVDFNGLRNYYPYGIELERVDLKTDDIQLKLFVNKDTLKRALDFEKKIQSNSNNKKEE